MNVENTTVTPRVAATIPRENRKIAEVDGADFSKDAKTPQPTQENPSE